MFKKIKKCIDKVNIRELIADVLLIAALAVLFFNTYDISSHYGLYVLSIELAAVAIMLVRSGRT